MASGESTAAKTAPQPLYLVQRFVNSVDVDSGEDELSSPEALRDWFAERGLIGGGAKVMWTIFVIILPFLGVFIYLITQGQEMAERDVSRAQAAQAQFDDHVRSVSGGAAAEIDKAKQLLDSGAITQAEFDAIKAKALA